MIQIRHDLTGEILVTLNAENLNDARLVRANLRGANLREKVMRRADLRGVDLSGACLRGADLTQANLYGADLTSADLRNATLSEADLRHSTLVGADLTGADLSDAELREADLTKAELREVNLSEANFCQTEGISQCIVDGGLRSDGYRFFLTNIDDGPWRIRAGCRHFELKEAVEHWNRTRGGTDLGDETLAIVDHMVAVARARGWPE